MSVVSGIVLCASVCEENGTAGEFGMPLLFQQIDSWLQTRMSHWRLTMIEGHFRGGKHPQMYVAGAGLNYFPEDEFADFVLSLPWERPENLVLLIQPEDGATRVFRMPD